MFRLPLYGKSESNFVRCLVSLLFVVKEWKRYRKLKTAIDNFLLVIFRLLIKKVSVEWRGKELLTIDKMIEKMFDEARKNDREMEN